MANGRRVRAFCSSISMSREKWLQKKLDTVMHHLEKFVYDHESQKTYQPTFYADKFLRERSYFEMWQKSALANIIYI